MKVFGIAFFSVPALVRGNTDNLSDSPTGTITARRRIFFSDVMLIEFRDFDRDMIHEKYTKVVERYEEEKGG